MDVPVQAAPARRQPQTVTQPDGTCITVQLNGDEFCHWYSDLEGRLLVIDSLGFYRLATPDQQQHWQQIEVPEGQQRRLQANALRSASGGSHYSFPSQGQIRGLVVLVEFPDLPFTIDEPLDEYTRMMTQDGYDHTEGNSRHYGSAHDYFYQNSLGMFDPQFDVYGPITLSQPMAYYGRNNDANAWQIITESCDYLDSIGVDFTPYDNDLDGKIDFVFAFYAGPGENVSGVSSSHIWPHQSRIPNSFPNRYDDLQLGKYACTCELFYGHLDGVGTFCHEFSHVLGLPDIYDVHYSSCTPGDYDVLDNGCYRRNGYHPVGYSAYERYELGWCQPQLLPDSTTALQLPEFGLNNQCYLLPITEEIDDPRTGEYYLFENRQQCAWDTYLPGHGMLIWHIDFNANNWRNNTVNTTQKHQGIDLIEADGQKRQSGQYIQDATTPFPGTALHTTFSANTTPAFCGWTSPTTTSAELGHDLGRTLSHIREGILDDEHPEQTLIAFDHYLTDPESLTSPTRDTEATPTRYLLHDGQLLLQTPSGWVDLMGRMHP